MLRLCNYQVSRFCLSILADPIRAKWVEFGAALAPEEGYRTSSKQGGFSMDEWMDELVVEPRVSPWIARKSLKLPMKPRCRCASHSGL